MAAESAASGPEATQYSQKELTQKAQEHGLDDTIVDFVVPSAGPQSAKPAQALLQAMLDDMDGDFDAPKKAFQATSSANSVVIDPSSLPSTVGPSDDMAVDASTSQPRFKPLDKRNLQEVSKQYRKIMVTPNRFNPLKQAWLKIYNPVVTHLKLDIRMNTAQRAVELRTNEYTTDTGALQKATDFIKAFMYGFDLDDAIALLRLDDLYIDTFEIKDVKTLHGDHLSRAIGRIAGRQGKTKHTIENATKTRIVLADSKIHIMGSFQNIKIARDAVVNLILGSPPGKVYSTLRTISARMKERF
ncbi:pre-rRNA-processing protein pno1 [Dimargaris verticillata]|uniref:Pre-rRNA-processing protein PNO1 n=1 Tax=Dimargaris verticillata TaxID=2761393 RepID=A0A9W8EBJ5_9FUNG|nr:pre-rRNA-processing protein pno1 [Dimargaris verticillata]